MALIERVTLLDIKCAWGSKFIFFCQYLKRNQRVYKTQCIMPCVLLMTFLALRVSSPDWQWPCELSLIYMVFSLPIPSPTLILPPWSCSLTDFAAVSLSLYQSSFHMEHHLPDSPLPPLLLLSRSTSLLAPLSVCVFSPSSSPLPIIVWLSISTESFFLTTIYDSIY